LIFGRRELLGIDIGTSAIKVAEVRDSKSGYQLKNIGESLLHPEAIVDKVIVDQGAVVDVLSSLIDDLRIKTKNVVISISGNSVIIKKVSLPVMSDNELREAIPWELKQLITQNIEEINYDYQVLPGEDSEGRMEVLIAAAKKDITNDYLAVVNEVGLNPIVVDVDLFALENLYDINYSDVNGILALVNIGACITNINILKDGMSIFTRDLNMGGNKFTEWIQKEFNIGYDDAEKMKLSLGRSGLPPELDKLTQDFLDTICRDIRKTMDFFSSTYLMQRVDKIMLSGGSSKIPNLKKSLESITESKVESVDPFKKVSFNERDFDPEFIKDIAPKMAVAMGLALRRDGDRR